MENLHIASELTDNDSEEAQEGRNGGTQVGGLVVLISFRINERREDRLTL